MCDSLSRGGSIPTARQKFLARYPLHRDNSDLLVEFIGHVLNQVSATKATITSRVYARYTYEKEKREALALWAGKLAGILAGANVVPLARVG